MTSTALTPDEPDGRTDGWVSIPEFARHWGLGESTVRHWVRDGKIPSVHLNGTIRIPRKTLNPNNWKENTFND